MQLFTRFFQQKKQDVPLQHIMSLINSRKTLIAQQSREGSTLSISMNGFMCPDGKYILHFSVSHGLVTSYYGTDLVKAVKCFNDLT